MTNTAHAPSMLDNVLHTHVHTHALSVSPSLSECVILTALARQQWFRERASMLGCTYIASLVVFVFVMIITSLSEITFLII
jgi:hypothetical protein